MELDARIMIQIGAVIASLAGAWGLVRSQVATLKQRQEEQRKYVDELNRELDAVENSVSVLRQQITVLSNILSPSNLEEQNRWRGSVSERVKKAEEEINVLHKMHNGKHPKVEQG
jgi:chromosome segregation ATPase